MKRPNGTSRGDVHHVHRMKRILVIGCSGVGKSTLAAKIAAKTGIPFIATDALYWRDDWQAVPMEAVLRQLEQATKTETWILDGNVDNGRDVIWQRADTIIWLDYALPRLLWQVTRRNIMWWLQRKSWTETAMTWQHAWSGIRHAYRSHALKRAHYPEYLYDFPHAKIYHFRQPKEAQRWLLSLNCTDV